MTLLRPDDLDADEVAYRIFQVTRDRTPWRIEDVLREGRFSDDPARAERAWRVASAGYYAEQAGLVAAATLAVETEDAPLRFSLALATADEARHADAFYRYAKLVGGEPADAQETMQPLDDGLTSLPYMGRARCTPCWRGWRPTSSSCSARSSRATRWDGCTTTSAATRSGTSRSG
ncbi:hypothetical protein [Micromonospora echinospora]|uniref:hypothetical protein n=1 Tax=Micromonospora echinospora TaxID=1877 RepID=UPI003A89C7E2